MRSIPTGRSSSSAWPAARSGCCARWSGAMRRRGARCCATRRWSARSAGPRSPPRRSRRASPHRRIPHGTRSSCRSAPACPRRCSARRPQSRRWTRWPRTGSGASGVPASVTDEPRAESRSAVTQPSIRGPLCGGRAREPDEAGRWRGAGSTALRAIAAMAPRASLFVTGGFAILPLIVAALFVGGVAWAGRRLGEPADARRRHTAIAAAGTAVWLLLTLLAAASGVLRRFDALPPPFAGLVLAVIVLGVGVPCSRLGTRLVRGLPLWALVGYQVFRFPLELLMHRAYTEGV